MTLPSETESRSEAESFVEIDKILPYARPRFCPEGMELIATGEEAECFFYVESGTFEVSYQPSRLPSLWP